MRRRTTETIAKAPMQRGEATQILTVQQVADLLQIPKSSVYEQTRYRGSIGRSPLPCRRVGRYLRFISSEVDAWLRALPLSVNRTKRQYRRKEDAA